MEKYVEGITSKGSPALANNTKGRMASAQQISFLFLIFTRLALLVGNIAIVASLVRM